MTTSSPTQQTDLPAGLGAAGHRPHVVFFQVDNFFREWVDFHIALFAFSRFAPWSIRGYAGRIINHFLSVGCDVWWQRRGRHARLVETQNSWLRQHRSATPFLEITEK